MRLRLIRVFALVAVLAGAFAGIARALDFDEEDPHPPRGEIGATYYYKIGAHAGCLPYHFVIDSGQLPPGLKLSDLDIKTGLVRWEWHSLDHAGVSESHVPVPANAAPWDWFHLNSIDVEPDGNLLISARSTWAARSSGPR